MDDTKSLPVGTHRRWKGKECMRNRVQLRRLVFMAGTIVLSGSLLAEHTPLHALDLFGSKKEEQPTTLRQINQLPNFVDIAKTTMPSVVNISTTQKASPRRPQQRRQMPMPGPILSKSPIFRTEQCIALSLRRPALHSRIMTALE